MAQLSLIERLALRQYEAFCSHWYCHYCEAPLMRPGEEFEGDYPKWRWQEHDGRRFYIGRTPATIDHVIPRTKGGTNDISNLVLCCKQCNSIKGNRPLWAFEALTKEWMWRNRHFMIWVHQEWANYYYLA
jgi:hypothetical protein